MHQDRAGPVLVIIHGDDLVPRKACKLAADSPDQAYLARHTRSFYPATQCTGEIRPSRRGESLTGKVSFRLLSIDTVALNAQ